jgi:hypothetical protein
MKNKRLFFCMTGAFLFWIVGGFRKNLNEELADTYYYRNLITTVVVWFLFVFLCRSC